MRSIDGLLKKLTGCGNLEKKYSYYNSLPIALLEFQKRTQSKLMTCVYFLRQINEKKVLEFTVTVF